jgi:hypothetical protein
MEEIKHGTSVIDFFLFGGGHALYQPSTVDSVALQLRKMLELIAFGSLVANQQAYSAAYTKFAENWNARLMLRDVERLSPDFYPKPVVEAPSADPKVRHNLVDRGSDFLSRDEFEKAYEKCGAILHADNPYGSKVDYGTRQ